MNETKRILIMLGIIVGIAGIMTISIIVNGNYFDKSKEKVEELMASQEDQLIYLGRPTCPFCAEMEPYLKNYSNRFDIDYLYINTDNLTDLQLQEILSYFNVSLAEFGTPYIVTVSNNEVTDEMRGFPGPSYLVDFFKRTGFIPEDAQIDGITNPLTEEEYEELKENLINTINSAENQLIFYNSDTCIHCIEMKPVLNRYANDYQFSYFDLSIDVLNDEQIEEVLNLAGATRDGFGTPYTVVVRSGEKTDELRGNPGEQPLLEFLISNGFANS